MALTPILDAAGLEAAALALAALARAEDLGARGDITTRLMDGATPATFRLLLKQPGVFCGRQVVETILAVFDPALSVAWQPGAADGQRFDGIPVQLATLRGPLAGLLAAERTLLNFLQHLSGVATLTRGYVNAVAGTRAKVYDTRKTLPGWRLLDKYAVHCGGGHNHRIGLHDAILIKDNHLADVPAERVSSAMFEILTRAADLSPPPTFVEVEADTLAQVEQLFKVAGIDIILLDNFQPADLRRAVERRDQLGLTGRVELEASGGINLTTIRAVAETGVDRISVGALTHSAPALDVSLEHIAAVR